MKVTKTIAAPRDFVFEKVLESGKYDVKKQTGKAAPANLKGFSYSKQFSASASGRITFDEVKRPEIYSFSTVTNRTAFTTTWHFVEVDGENTEITVDETRQASGFIQQINDMIVGFFFTRTKKSRMMQIFAGLEKEYQKK
jgi:hypothetical protein